MELKTVQLSEFVNGQVVGGVEAMFFYSPEYAIIFGRDSQVSTNTILLPHQHCGIIAGCQAGYEARGSHSPFDGQLGCYPHKKIKLNMPLDAHPIQKRSYPISYWQDNAFKMEMKEMVEDGVLRRKHEGSEWDSPTLGGIYKGQQDQDSTYSIPYQQETAFKKEIEAIVNDGVLRGKYGGSE